VFAWCHDVSQDKALKFEVLKISSFTLLIRRRKLLDHHKQENIRSPVSRIHKYCCTPGQIDITMDCRHQKFDLCRHRPASTPQSPTTTPRLIDAVAKPHYNSITNDPVASHLKPDCMRSTRSHRHNSKMVLLSTSEEWQQQSALLLQARPTSVCPTFIPCLSATQADAAHVM
jgi:hypothetical protein